MTTSHRRIRLIPVLLIPVVLSLLLPLGVQAQHDPQAASSTSAASDSLHAVADDYFAAWLARNPVQATILGFHEFSAHIPRPFDVEARNQYRRTLETLDRRLDRIDPLALNERDQLTTRVLRERLALEQDGLTYPESLLGTNQLTGPQLLPILIDAGLQPFRTTADYDAFLSRLRGVASLLDRTIAALRSELDGGFIAPRPVVARMLPQVERLVVDDPTASVFYRPVTTFPDTIPASAQARLTDDYRAVVGDTLLPAYRRFHRFLRDEYLDQARDAPGLVHQPGGRAWYRYRMREATGLELDPTVVHAYGQQVVEQLRAEMDSIRQVVGFEGSLSAFQDHLREAPQYYFSDPDSLLAAFQVVHDEVERSVDDLFVDPPDAPLLIRPFGANRAASAALGQYIGPSADGSRPGIMFVNTERLDEFPRRIIETLFLHEGIPGHHFQAVAQRELEGLPAFRQYSAAVGGGRYIAYGEGWALYAETLGPQMGFFTDPLSYYGHLDDAMLRAARLVVDTGIHWFGWSRQRAVDYMLANVSFGRADMESEVDRYIADPGQALGYKIGERTILQLRRQAEERLGETFALRTFHRRVLQAGPVSMDALEWWVARWIERDAENPSGEGRER